MIYPLTEATKFDISGELAAALKCWHRLTGVEAQELVDFVAALRAKTDHITDFGKKVDLDDLYSKLRSMSVSLEGSDRIYAEDIPGCYGAVLDLMGLVRSIQAEQPDHNALGRTK